MYVFGMLGIPVWKEMLTSCYDLRGSKRERNGDVMIVQCGFWFISLDCSIQIIYVSGAV